MKRFFKYVVVPIVTFSFLFLATVFVLPLLIDVQKYVPEIEEKLSEVTGRSVSIGPDLGLSFFPWLGVSFSDMKLGNPQGFSTDEFLKIESFEARIDLLPLLKKELQFRRFVVGGLEVNLQNREDGSVNWDFSRKGDGGPATASALQSGDWYLPEGVSISLLAVTDGLVNYNDSINQSQHKVADLMLLVNNVNTEGPTGVDLKASVDGKPLEIEGKIASIGNKFGKDPLAIDLGVAFLNSLKGKVKGQITNLQTNLEYDLVLQVAPFSLRELFDVLDVSFPIVTNDPKAFSSLELHIPAKGSREQFAIEKGRATLDETDLDFSLALMDFSQPDLGFSLDIGKLDLNLYMAPDTDEKGRQEKGAEGGQVAYDYRSLDKLTFAGAIRIGELRVGGGTVNDVTAQVSFADGIFEMDPMSFGLYQGQAHSTIAIDFQGQVPKTDIEIQTKDVHSALLLDDLVGTDFLSGTMNADLVLQLSGDSKVAMKKNLNGEGTLLFRDGALTGTDLARTLGGLKDALSASDSTDQRARTDFSELAIDITITKGLIESKEATLISPYINLLVTGTADIVTEQLDLKFEPKVTETTQGQGKKEENSVASMPLEISGSFADLIMNIDAAKFSADEPTMQASAEAQSLVDKKLPSPADEDVKSLVGKPLVNPTVVAQRFGIQTETIDKSQIKNQRQVGSGKVQISPLREEAALYQAQ